MCSSGRQPWDANDPYPDDDGPECDHMGYEVDILTGIAECDMCGARWEQTDAQRDLERQAQADYDKACLEWEIEQARDFDPAAYRRAMIGEQPQKFDDDEIPF